MKGERFGEAFASHRKTFVAFARSLTHCEHAAQDLVQEAAIKAFQSKKSLRNTSSFKSWVFRIIHNVYLNNFRKRKRRRELMDRASDTFFLQVSSRNDGYEALKVDDIKSLTQNIGERSYQALSLFFKGYSYREISDRLQINMGTVKSRIHFSRNALRDAARRAGMYN